MTKLPHVANCPVNAGHLNSVVYGPCEHCGLLVIGCLDGCSETAILEALYPDPAKRPVTSGHPIMFAGGE